MLWFEISGMFRRLWPWFLILAIPAAASVQSVSLRVSQAVLVQREQRFWKTPVRASEFSDVPQEIGRAHV